MERGWRCCMVESKELWDQVGVFWISVTKEKPGCHFLNEVWKGRDWLIVRAFVEGLQIEKTHGFESLVHGKKQGTSHGGKIQCKC